MTATQRFIEKAIEGGWRPGRFTDEQWERVKDLYPTSGINEWQLDPASWRAVGKVEGWNRSFAMASFGTIGYNDEDDGDVFEDRSLEMAFPEWHYRWSRLIDALAEEKTIEEYLATIV